MLVNKLSGFVVTEEYKDKMGVILTRMYEQRDSNWGNARVIENIQSDAIRRCLKLHFDSPIIGVDCIDEKYLRFL